MNEQDDKREALISIEEEFHPTCRMCGEYIFAVDGCKGHGDEKQTEVTVVTPEAWLEVKTPTIWKHLYHALVRRLVEIADEPSATERMIDYDRVARAHEPNIKEEDQ